MTKFTLSSVIVSAFLAFFFAPPANAQTSARAWVSGHGNDAAGCGPASNPCRTLQYVHDNVIAAAGEIDILDPAGYGPISIYKALSIINDGVGTAGVLSSSGNAIDIWVGPSDTVTLRGLTVEGLGTGQNGIVSHNGGGALEIIDCTIRNFSSAGIEVRHAFFSSMLISNTLVLDNGTGIQLDGGANVVKMIAAIDRVTIANNTYGFLTTAGSTFFEAQISNSHIDNNTNTGISLTSYSTFASSNIVLIESTINQTPTAVSLNGYSNVWLSHVIQSAAPGIANSGFVLSGVNNNVFSDGTSHFNSGPCKPGVSSDHASQAIHADYRSIMPPQARVACLPDTRRPGASPLRHHPKAHRNPFRSCKKLQP